MQMQTTTSTEVPGMTRKSDNREAINGLFRRVCAEFGEASGAAIVRTIVEELGGLRISVPDIHDLEREERDRRIRILFNGTNYSDLSERFGLSRSQVRNIIDGERRRQ